LEEGTETRFVAFFFVTFGTVVFLPVIFFVDRALGAMVSLSD
jgi:hypothetical protein